MSKLAGPARTFVMVVAAVALSSCASTSGGTTGGAAEGEGVAFVVINDRTPPAPITVYLVPETGSRRRLGTVQPNGQQTFRFAPPAPSQQFRLLAEAVGERDAQSLPFTLLDASQIDWSTSSQNVRVRR